MSVRVVDHPLVKHKLSLMRSRDTTTMQFRQLTAELAALIGYEVTRDLQLCNSTINTPLEEMDAPFLKGKKLVLASILRAGEGMLEGMLYLLPAARVCHIGLYRNHDTMEAVEYFFKAPEDLTQRVIIVVDPMLATGNSAVKAINLLKAHGAKDIRFASILSVPQGIAHLKEAHSDVDIYTGAIDRELDGDGYIRPGLGDAGDRIYGTK